MKNTNFTLLLSLTSGFILLILLLTDTHASFSCQVDTNNDEENATCADVPITTKREEICNDSSFIIHANIPTKGDPETVKIVCPWSTQSVSVLTFGALFALLYTGSAILQRKKKSVLPGKSLLGVGIMSLCLVGAATVSMVLDIMGGRSKCKKFTQMMQGFETDCSIALYMVTILFCIVSLGLLAYEIFLGYERYKSEQLFIEAGEQGIFIPKGDFNKGLFKEDTTTLDE